MRYNNAMYTATAFKPIYIRLMNYIKINMNTITNMDWLNPSWLNYHMPVQWRMTYLFIPKFQRLHH